MQDFPAAQEKPLFQDSPEARDVVAGGGLLLFVLRTALVFGTLAAWIGWLWPEGLGAPTNASLMLGLGAGLLYLWSRQGRDRFAMFAGVLGWLLGTIGALLNPALGWIGAVGAAVATISLVWWFWEIVLGWFDS